MERCWLVLDEEGGVLEPLGDVRVRRHLANVFAASAVRSVDLRVGSPVDCYQHSRAEVVAEPASNAIAQALVLSSLFHNLIGRDLRRVKMLDERSMV